jgi:hypothetical protein
VPYKLSGHRARLRPLGPGLSRQRCEAGWSVACDCGWSASPFANRALAKEAYAAHLQSALYVCKRCGVSKLHSQMSKTTPHLCKPCSSAKSREWKALHPKEWDRSARRSYLKKTYGMTPEQYDALLARQGGRCAICVRNHADSREFRLHVDHDHSTGRVRGLLCGLCNQGIGSLRDDPSLLRIAIAYLLQHESKEANL